MSHRSWRRFGGAPTPYQRKRGGRQALFRFEIPSVRVTANKRGRKSTASPLNHFRFCVSPFNYATSFGDSRFHGYTNFLVEAGGELRARGSWTIGIEHPTRS